MMKRQLQVALDLRSTEQAVSIASSVVESVDIIEAGTVLCLAQGLPAVSALKKVCLDKPLLADIRISRAGKKFADMCYEAGATRVSLVGECPDSVVASAALAAQGDRQFEIELYPGWRDSDIKRFIDYGACSLIVHRDKCTPEENSDIKNQLERLSALVEGSACTVTLAGGLTAESLQEFIDYPFTTAVCGSAITHDADPLSAARKIKELLEK